MHAATEDVMSGLLLAAYTDVLSMVIDFSLGCIHQSNAAQTTVFTCFTFWSANLAWRGSSN